MFQASNVFIQKLYQPDSYKIMFIFAPMDGFYYLLGLAMYQFSKTPEPKRDTLMRMICMANTHRMNMS